MDKMPRTRSIRTTIRFIATNLANQQQTTGSTENSPEYEDSDFSLHVIIMVPPSHLSIPKPVIYAGVCSSVFHMT